MFTFGPNEAAELLVEGSDDGPTPELASLAGGVLASADGFLAMAIECLQTYASADFGSWHPDVLEVRLGDRALDVGGDPGDRRKRSVPEGAIGLTADDDVYGWWEVVIRRVPDHRGQLVPFVHRFLRVQQ